MFKLLFISFLLSFNLFGDTTNISSFSADFTQVIIDDKNKKLIYKGTFLANSPFFALWSYDTPIKKNIYIEKNKVTIVEPELEQAIIKKLDKEINFFYILSNLKKVDKNNYIALLASNTYNLKFSDYETLESISYNDDFGNSVEIVFQNQKTNLKVSPDVFVVRIPYDYDIIE